MINFKLRLQNKTTLLSLVVLIISFTYTLLNVVGIAPKVEQEEIVMLAKMAVDILCVIGIVVDPTTPGIEDSERAMQRQHIDEARTD